MPIAREGKFLVRRTLGNTPHLGLESSILASCIKEARAAGYRGVFGSPAFGFKERTLDSLRSLQDLESIWFWDIELDDVDAVYELRALQSFGVHPRRPPVDFSRLPSLKRLVVEFKPRDCGVQTLDSLETLHMWHYSPKTKTFAALMLPPKLVELQINWANPKSLEGITPLPSLRRLEIHRCRNFETLSTLPDLFPNLEYLVVATCGKVEGNIASGLISRLPRLTHGYVQGIKLALADG